MKNDNCNYFGGFVYINYEAFLLTINLITDPGFLRSELYIPSTTSFIGSMQASLIKVQANVLKLKVSLAPASK